MKGHTFVATAILALLLYSCTSYPEFMNSAPQWAAEKHDDTEDAFAFRGTGVAGNFELAREEAMEALLDSIFLSINLGDPSRWDADGRSAVQSFRNTLEKAVRNPDDKSFDGLRLLHKAAWRDVNDVSYIVDILWEKKAFALQVDELVLAVNTSSLAYRDLEKRAEDAEADGNIYESALLWATAASMGKEMDNASDSQQALMQIPRLLQTFTYNLESVPEDVTIGLSQFVPVIFRISAGNRPIANAEFVVTYTPAQSEFSGGSTETRILSNPEGLVVFRPPAANVAGVQKITVAPSADPFVGLLKDIQNDNIRNFIEIVEQPVSFAQYSAINRTRTIPTGVMIIETDLAGNVLTSSAASKGLIDNLVADGFDVQQVNFGLQNANIRDDTALFRELNTNSLLSGQFSRVIHGRVSLESFEQDGENFTVRVGGTLILSDISTQAVLYRSNIVKTSRAGDSQQAIISAFRQLGRSFASEIIQRTP